MIDATRFLSDFDRSSELLERKGFDRTSSANLRDALAARKQIAAVLEAKRAEMNTAAEGIGKLMQTGQRAEADAARQAVSALKPELAELELKHRQADELARGLLLRTPNFPSETTPIGQSEAENVVVRTHGYNPADYAGRRYRPHWELATEAGIFDAERASKLSGSGFAVLRGDGSRLLRGLVEFALHLNRSKYEEFTVPHFVSSDTFTTTGHLPKFEADAYKLRDDDLWAVPTGEVPLTGMHRDEVLDESDLPLRYMAHTSCFRREAGAAGKDTRGMQRLHEFHKVELVRICKPEDEQSEFDDLLADAERPLKELNLPYRIVNLCTRDLTFSSAQIYDIEVYSPGVEKWLEVSSVGKFTDFQARRGNIRFRRAATRKTELVHLLNGSGLATPRVWAAVIEHNQQQDGSIRVPKPLVPFVGTEVIRPRKKL